MPKFGKAQFERRIFPRFKLEIPISYEHELEALPPREGRTGDISAGGLLVYLSDRVLPGDQLRIRMRLTDPNAPRMLDLLCRVSWVEIDENLVKAGLTFEDIKPEELELLQQFQGLWLEQSY